MKKFICGKKNKNFSFYFLEFKNVGGKKMSRNSIPYCDYMENYHRHHQPSHYSHHNEKMYRSLSRSRTDDLDQFQSNSNLSRFNNQQHPRPHPHQHHGNHPQPRANSQDASLDDSASAQIIRKIVQDLVDLQHQIIGGEIRFIPKNRTYRKLFGYIFRTQILRYGNAFEELCFVSFYRA